MTSNPVAHSRSRSITRSSKRESSSSGRYLEVRNTGVRPRLLVINERRNLHWVPSPGWEKRVLQRVIGAERAMPGACCPTPEQPVAGGRAASHRSWLPAVLANAPLPPWMREYCPELRCHPDELMQRRYQECNKNYIAELITATLIPLCLFAVCGARHRRY